MKLEDEIKDSANDIKIPERLKPENIDKLLNEAEPLRQNELKEVVTTKKEQPFFLRKKTLATVAGLAACAGVMIVSMQVLKNYKINSQGEPQQVAKSYDEIYDFLEREEMKESIFQQFFGGTSKTNEAITFDSDAGAVYEESSGEEPAPAPAEADSSRSEHSAQSSSDAEIAGSNTSGTQASSANKQGSTDFTKTNLQVEGVDEGDIVKTDENYFYIVKNYPVGYNHTKIVQKGEDDDEEVVSDGLKNAVIQVVSRNPKLAIDTELQTGISEVKELYIQGKKLVVVGTRLVEREYVDSSSGRRYEDIDETEMYDVAKGYYYGNMESLLTVEFYDLSDINNPKLENETTMKTNYNTSRIVDGVLYVISEKWIPNIYNGNIKKEEVEKYVPVCDGKAMAAEEIELLDSDKEKVANYNKQYVIVNSFDVSQGGKSIAKKATIVSGYNNLIYVSKKRVYLTREWNYETNIVSYCFEAGKLSNKHTTTIPGYVHERFCLDESDDYLRVVVTERNDSTNYEDARSDGAMTEEMPDVEEVVPTRVSTTNSVFVLDSKLTKVGEIRGLAKNERIYSARFFGDKGYFVTYRETDPLFSVDFKDPKNPKIIGKLKIPGFSEYMQFFDEDHLFGIGMEDNRVKISMFDVSNPSDVKEVDKKILSNAEYSEAFSDSHSVLLDKSRSLVGFPVRYSNEDYSNYETYIGYYVFTYSKENGFEKKYFGSFLEENGAYQMRSVRVDDSCYVIRPQDKINEISLLDFQKKDSLSLK